MKGRVWRAVVYGQVAAFAAGLAVGLLVRTPFGSKASTPPTDASVAIAGDSAEGGPVAVVSGTVPAAVNGAASIVVLLPNPPRPLPDSESSAAVLDQVAKMFTPDILFARTDVPVEFRNSDDTLHNVNVTYSSTKEQTFNVGIIPETTYHFTFKKDGIYEVHCDIHQSMASIIVVAASPYAKVAEADGSVRFDHVEPGTYTATVYSGMQKLEKAVTISAPRTDIAIRN